MLTSTRRGCLRGCIALHLVMAAEGQGQVNTVLRFVDSVRIAESDTFLLSRPTRMHAGGQGSYFVLDARESRVVEIGTNGVLRRRFGRAGAGPGELRRPASVTTSGDSLLSVWDIGNQRVMSYDLRTGQSRGSFALGGWFPNLKYDRGELRIGVMATDSTTSVVALTPSGERRRAEGHSPALFRRSPPLVAGFGQVFFADDGNDTYAMFEVSNDLYHWKRGERTADVTTIPQVARKGVRPTLFDELMRDPKNSGALAYDRSMLLGLHRLGPGRVAMVTLDGTVEKGANFVGIQRVTIVDVAQRRACVDVPVPANTEPLAVLTFVRDTLVVLQQGEDAAGEPGTWITRHVIDTRRCAWQPLAASRPER